MAKCENCYHCEICKKAAINVGISETKLIKVLNEEFEHIEGHDCFKDKSLIVELPCKVGDTVYHIPRNPHGHIVTLIVVAIHISDEKLTRKKLHKSRKSHIIAVELNSKYGGPFNFDDFGESIFLTREDAEKALNAQNNA